MELYNFSASVKFVIKSDSLLLEARGVEARSEEQNHTGALPLYFDLALFDSRWKHESLVFEVRTFSKGCLRLKVAFTYFDLSEFCF